MRSRLSKLGIVLASLAAFAAGGAALATAGSHANAKPAKAGVAKPNPWKAGGAQSQRDSQPGAPDTDNVQEGDQSTRDNPSEQSSESASEGAGSESASESGPSDGPGGYADSNSTADTQQQGEN